MPASLTIENNLRFHANSCAFVSSLMIIRFFLANLFSIIKETWKISIFLRAVVGENFGLDFHEHERKIFYFSLEQQQHKKRLTLIRDQKKNKNHERERAGEKRDENRFSPRSKFTVMAV
jgi:hypothetical protein